MLTETRLNKTIRWISDEDKWQAVAKRDGKADGQFYYSVATTGVYCRPSCGARLARRENVAFHASCDDAEQAGFRPCKRCLPNSASIAERNADAVAKACETIRNAEEMPSLEDLAVQAGMSRFHFHRVFKSVTGVTPKAYASAYLAGRVREELRSSNTVTEAIYDAGYNSNSRFYERSHKMLGMTPSSYRAGGKGEKIRFALAQCTLGAILGAASAKGVCTILLGDDPDALVRQLEDAFPKAELIGGDPAFEDWMAQVIGLVEAPQLGHSLPLDIRGTAFQQRVWQALSEIPVGTKASYAEIAEKIGSPRATRAVAQACAANSIAVAIPCHRVVRKDGDLSGYRWGVERKQTLLDLESGEAGQ